MSNELIEQMSEGEVVEEVTVEQGFEALDDNMKVLIERQGTKMPEAEEEVAEGEVVEDEQVAEEIVDEPEHLFELEDGTKVTEQEAKDGYLRHGSYTKKVQELAEERKRIERFGAIMARMENDPKLMQMNIDYMTGNQQAQPQSTVGKVEVPDDYKGVPFIENLVTLTNTLSDKVTQLEGGYNTIQQSSAEEKQASDRLALFNSKMSEGYEYLKGQVGTPPTPKEYIARFQKYIEDQGLDPQVVGNYIIGGDPDYLRAKIDGTFKTDIDAYRTDKVNTGEKERKKRVAKTQTLQVAGKSQQAAPQPLPKGKDGKLDTKAALIQIMDAQDQLNRR
jgi:hypothetical protein